MITPQITAMLNKIVSTLHALTENLPEAAIASFKETFTKLSIVDASMVTFEKNIDMFYEGVSKKFLGHIP